MLARTSPIYGAKIFPLCLSFEDGGNSFICLGVWVWGETGRRFEICSDESDVKQRFGLEITEPTEEPLYLHLGSGAEPTEAELLTLLETKYRLGINELREAA